MRPPSLADVAGLSGPPGAPAEQGFGTRALMILWPAFVMAGVLDAMVFAVVDPEDLTWFGAEALGWSRSAVYTVTFFIFWGAIATSAAMTELLRSPPRT